jgi:hypothetical protein
MVDLRAVTIHCAPAMSIDPPANAGMERYDSPIDGEEMLAHIIQQVEPLRELNELTGGILQIETVDITNFRDGGFKLPTYLQLQTGAWMDLIWLKKQAGVSVTFDSEHHFCAGNVIMRQRDMAVLPFSCLGVPSPEEDELALLCGYWLRRGCVPDPLMITDIKSFILRAQPRLFHFGAAVQAEIDGEIGTHLPYDRQNQEQIDLLDQQLVYMMADNNCLGGVTEVVGRNQYIDDPTNHGHNRYSQWSPRESDDELAKEQTLGIIIERLEALSTL